MSPLLEALANDSARGYGLGLPSGGGSSFESIATATPSGVTSVTFSSIPSTYKHLQIRGIGRTNGGANSSYLITATFNSDSTAANYAYHYLRGNGTNAAAVGTTATGNAIIGLFPSSGSTASAFGATICDILDYANTSKYKTIRGFTGSDTNTASASFSVNLNSSLWLSTSAVTSLTITGEAAFAAGSTFALYGIKG